MRIAALVKQIPKFEDMTLGPDGRLQRAGVPLAMNDYCRRAVAQACALAAEHGGAVEVITLGPPSAEDVLREALTYAEEHAVPATGVLVTDPAFAGSDTLATARALAAVLRRRGPFDLVLTGRNSLDADTGQVGPELAELLDLPFATAVRHLHVAPDGVIDARCEHDDGWVQLRTRLPAVLSCAERLIDPCKIKEPERWTVDSSAIVRLDAADLGPGPWGQAASPTSVGDARTHEVTRQRWMGTGDVATQVRDAVALLVSRGALDPGEVGAGSETVPATGGAGAVVAVLVEPERERLTAELASGAATLAARIGGSTAALVSSTFDAGALAALGVDRIVSVTGLAAEDDLAATFGDWVQRHEPWALLAPSTCWGREVASRIAARLGAGLTGDAVALDVDAGSRLVAWKPAFGGSLVAAIHASSPVQLATVRPGTLPCLAPRRAARPAPVEQLAPTARGRVEILARTRDDDLDVLADADVVVGVGQGVPPERYGDLEPLLAALGAVLGATRKVTDLGWLPRARQIGITGRSIAPRLYVAVGVSGKFNHMVGVRAARTVLAVDADPDAPVFRLADMGIVGDWAEVVPALVTELARVTPPRAEVGATAR